MIYCFLGDNNRDKDLFESILKTEWTGITFCWENQDSIKKTNNANIYIPVKWDVSVSTDFFLNYDFILEYAYKVYSKEHCEFHVKNIIHSLANHLIKIIQSNDIVFALNSGEYCARLLKELSHLIGFKFYFIDSFYLKDTLQASEIPFTQSIYGYPEFINLLSESKFIDTDIEEFIDDYIITKSSKYDQKEVSSILENLNINYTSLKKCSEIDIFIPGQVPLDSNIVLNNESISSSEILCEVICKSHPNKIIGYKPHPGAVSSLNLKKLFEYENLVFLKDSVWDIFKKSKEIHTLSSTVGIEAMIYGKPVFWYSNFYSKFYTNLDIKHFLSVSRRYAIKRNDFTNWVENIIHQSPHTD